LNFEELRQSESSFEQRKSEESFDSIEEPPKKRRKNSPDEVKENSPSLEVTKDKKRKRKVAKLPQAINDLEDREIPGSEKKPRNSNRRMRAKDKTEIEEWTVDEEIEYPKLKQGRNSLLKFIGYYEGKKANMDLLLKMKVPENEIEGWSKSAISPQSAIERAADETNEKYPGKFKSDWANELLSWDQNQSPILEIEADRTRDERSMRAVEPREKLEMYQHFPNSIEFIRSQVEHKLVSPLTKEKAKESLQSKSRVAMKIHTGAAKWESFLTLFYVFVKDHYGVKGFKGWSTFFSKKIVFDFLNGYEKDRISTRNNLSKNFQTILKMLRKNDNYYSIFGNTSCVLMHGLGNFREKRSDRDAHLSTRLSFDQKIKIGKAITEEERTKMFRDASERMKELMKSKNPKKMMEFQKILMTCMAWSCAMEVVQRRQVIESLTTDNIFYDKSSDCFALVIDIAEKTVRKVSMDKVPLLWPSILTPFIRHFLLKVHPKISTKGVNGMWVSSKGFPVQGETLSRWFISTNKDLTGKEIGFLEARHNASSLISIKANQMPIEERAAYIEMMTSNAGHSPAVFDKFYNENQEEWKRINQQKLMSDKIKESVFQDVQEIVLKKREIDVSEVNLNETQFCKLKQILAAEDFDLVMKEVKNCSESH
jgi:hypothetical protein